MEWYYVYWPWLTYKRIAQVCQRLLSFMYSHAPVHELPVDFELIKIFWLIDWFLAVKSAGCRSACECALYICRVDVVVHLGQTEPPSAECTSPTASVIGSNTGVYLGGLPRDFVTHIRHTDRRRQVCTGWICVACIRPVSTRYRSLMWLTQSYKPQCGGNWSRTCIEGIAVPQLPTLRILQCWPWKPKCAALKCSFNAKQRPVFAFSDPLSLHILRRTSH